MQQPTLTGTRKFDRDLTQLMHGNLHWLDVPERVKHLDSSLPYRYRATVSSCRLCSGLRDGTDISSTSRCWLSACRAFVPSELMWPSGVLCTWSETMELLPKLLRDTVHNTISFGHCLSTFFLSEFIQCITGFGDYALY